MVSFNHLLVLSACQAQRGFCGRRDDDEEEEEEEEGRRQRSGTLLRTREEQARCSSSAAAAGGFMLKRRKTAILSHPKADFSDSVEQDVYSVLRLAGEEQ